jgi:hypothetical protein
MHMAAMWAAVVVVTMAVMASGVLGAQRGLYGMSSEVGLIRCVCDSACDEAPG